jgi:hypothetical protein
LVYDLLLSRQATLKSFGKAKEIQTGMIAVLHTWDRTCPYTLTASPGGGVDKIAIGRI